MNLELSPHVYKRLEERGVPVQVLEAVLQTPEQTFGSRRRDKGLSVKSIIQVDCIDENLRSSL